MLHCTQEARQGAMRGGKGGGKGEEGLKALQGGEAVRRRTS